MFDNYGAVLDFIKLPVRKWQYETTVNGTTKRFKNTNLRDSGRPYSRFFIGVVEAENLDAMASARLSVVA